MSARSSKCTAAVCVLGLFVAACDGKPAPTPAPAPTTNEPASAPEPSRAAHRSRIPEMVARLHRNAFASNPEDATLGPVLCFVTLHGAALRRAEVHPLMLFESGSVGTWRQTPAGSEEPFFAELSSGEQKRVA